MRLTNMLLEQGQQHLFANWTVGADADKKKKFYDQVRTESGSIKDCGRRYVTARRSLLAAATTRRYLCTASLR